jgi:hypothetical protein
LLFYETRSLYVVQAGLELLPQPPQCLDCRHALPCSTTGFNLKGLKQNCFLEVLIEVQSFWLQCEVSLWSTSCPSSFPQAANGAWVDFPVLSGVSSEIKVLPLRYMAIFCCSPSTSWYWPHMTGVFKCPKNGIWLPLLCSTKHILGPLEFNLTL